MRRLLLSAVILGALAAVAAWGPRADATLSAQSRQAPAGTAHTGKAFKFNQVKPGVYHAVGTGAARRRRQLLVHRQRRRRDRRRRPRLPRRGLGAARGDQGGHEQARAHGDQHALSFRSRPRQPDLRQPGRHHRPRVHAADAAEQLDRHAALPELRDRAAGADRRPEEAPGGGNRRRPAGGAADADLGGRKQPRRAGRTQADAAERHADAIG